MSGILDIKFANVVVEILIENCDKVSFLDNDVTDD